MQTNNILIHKSALGRNSTLEPMAKEGQRRPYKNKTPAPMRETAASAERLRVANKSVDETAMTSIISDFKERRQTAPEQKDSQKISVINDAEGATTASNNCTPGPYLQFSANERPNISGWESTVTPADQQLFHKDSLLEESDAASPFAINKSSAGAMGSRFASNPNHSAAGPSRKDQQNSALQHIWQNKRVLDPKKLVTNNQTTSPTKNVQLDLTPVATLPLSTAAPGKFVKTTMTNKGGHSGFNMNNQDNSMN